MTVREGDAWAAACVGSSLGSSGINTSTKNLPWRKTQTRQGREEHMEGPDPRDRTGAKVKEYRGSGGGGAQATSGAALDPLVPRDL